MKKMTSVCFQDNALSRLSRRIEDKEPTQTQEPTQSPALEEKNQQILKMRKDSRWDYHMQIQLLKQKSIWLFKS